MPRYTFHLIANSHLDPVWLWDWREGLNEGLTTLRTMVGMMDEFPELTYIRGESLLYAHLEREDPATFARIQRLVAAGRWDPVGGNYLQPDTNLPATETLARIFLHGQRYFAEKFGRTATAAWAADSFGHSAGLPEILAAAGFRSFAFTRPFIEQCALPGPAFWWEGSAGSRVLAYRPPYGWYGCERDEMPRRLDGCLAAAANQPWHHVAVFYGLGNHGGGPTRRLLRDIADWAAAHPDIALVHSGLHRFFAALEAEIAARRDVAPGVHRGEMNFCQRGCYVSAARFKFAYRRAETALVHAESAATAAGLLSRAAAPALDAAWRGLMFNAFHDILPGSSIERALDEQTDWTRGLLHTARTVTFDALNALAAKINTTVPPPPAEDRPTAVPFLVWNPHPHEYHGPLEFEASLDYRPLWSYENRPDGPELELRGPDGSRLPFQRVAQENLFSPQLPWRARVVTTTRIPPLGWSIFTLGWVEGARRLPAPRTDLQTSSGAIANRHYRVGAAVGAGGITVEHRGRALFGETGFGVVTLEDPFGSWGSMTEESAAIRLTQVRHAWRIAAVETIEQGPLRAALWVKFSGGNSELELTLRLARHRAAIDIDARLLWNESRAHLKLVFPHVGDDAEFDVPGGVVRRDPCGEAPGGRWVRVRRDRQTFGFASDALYGFDTADGTFRASVVRSTRYACDARDNGDIPAWRPVADRGEYRFRFQLSGGGPDLPRLAAELEQPPLAQTVPPRPGKLPRAGSIVSLTPAHVRLLALKPAENGSGLIVRVQETAGRPAHPVLTLNGRPHPLGPLGPHALATFRLTRGRARPASLTEL